MTGSKQKITWQLRHKIFNAIIKLDIGREEELNFENTINREAYCVLYPFNAYSVVRDWFFKELDLIILDDFNLFEGFNSIIVNCYEKKDFTKQEIWNIRVLV